MPQDRYTISVDASSDKTDDVEQAVRDAGGTVLRTLTPASDFVQVVAEVDSDLADKLRDRDAVRYVERDHEATAVADGDSGGDLARAITDLADDTADALAGQDVPWGIERVNATALHDQGITGDGVRVSVVDSGIASAHPDLPVEGGRAQTTSDVAPPPWDDDNDHGTHCAGTLAAAHNDKGVLGGAPDVTLWADKVLQDSGRGSYSDISAGITAAADAGCKIISCSIGGSEPARSLEDALAFARERGAIPVCATGNAGADQVSYPARYADAVGVGASTPEDTVADFSNRGEGVDLVAPGVGVKSTVPGGYSESWQGTSMSAPLVSACLALLVGDGHSPTMALAGLLTTARDIGAPETAQGAGLADAAAALDELETMSQRDGHMVAIEGHGTHVNYSFSAGRIWATEARGGQVNPDDTISGEPGSMQASGSVSSGVDPYGYHGTRTFEGLSLADGSVPTADDVTVWVRPKGEDWIDWTAETLAQQQPEGPTIEERKARLAEAGRATDVGEIHDAQDFADAFEFRGEFIDGDLGYVLEDGEYAAGDADKEHPSGAFHSTFLPAIPSYSVKYVGNWEDPSKVHVTSPVAMIDLAYDEHVRFDGIRFESVQVARGDAMFVDCEIRDLGGKPSAGRFNNTVIGSQDVDRAGRWYGGGEVYLDYGTEVVVADDAAAYFTAPNNCSLLIRGSVSFSDPDKPLFDDARSITPADLGGGINELPCDHDAPVYD